MPNIFQCAGLTVLHSGPNHQLLVWLCLVPFPFLPTWQGVVPITPWFFNMWISSCVFNGSMSTLALMLFVLSWNFWPAMTTDLCWSSCNCCFFVFGIKFSFSIEYLLHNFSLKVQQTSLVFYLLASLIWVIDASLTLIVGSCCTLWKVSVNCIKIILIPNWVCLDCKNCWCHLVIPDSMYEVMNFCHLV